MRITSCYIDAFGAFRDRAFDDLDHAAVIIQGSNEAGKTTFFHFLKTMFYGVYPVEAANHPYVPRGGHTLQGQLTVRLSGGEEETVRRRLLSTPQGRRVDASGEHALRNRTLPALAHIPRSVFQSVYALRLADLVDLEGAAWDAVQDRLLGGLSIDSIRPARTVVDELRDEATSLWRSDNRGKPEAKALHRRRKDLRETARAARQRDEQLRSLSKEVARRKAELEALRAERVELKTQLKHIDRLRPVHDLLRQIKQQEARMGDPAAYADVPREPQPVLEDLHAKQEQLDERIKAAEAQAAKAKNTQVAVTEADQQVLEHAAAIREWTRRTEAHEMHQRTIDDVRHARTEARSEFETAADVLAADWDAAFERPVRRLPIAELRERVKAYLKAARQLRDTQARAETAGVHAGARKALLPWGAIALVGGALGLASWWAGLSIPGGTATGLAMAAVGLLQLYAAWSHNRTLTTQASHLNVAGRRKLAERRAERVAEVVADLPIPAPRLEEPDLDLVHDMKRLKDTMEALDALDNRLDELREVANQARQQVQALMEIDAVGDFDEEASLLEWVAQLEERLDGAETRAQAAAEASHQLPEVQDRMEALRAERDDACKREQSIVQALETLGRGSLEDGLHELDARRTAQRRAEAARDRLHTEFPDWKARKAQIDALADEAEAWTVDTAQHARLEQRLETVEEAIHAHEKTLTAHEKDIEHLSDERTLDDIESERAHLDQQLEHLREARDRLMLLANIVQKADYDFRMNHQPDVVKRASVFLRRITGGRYERIMLEDDSDRLVLYEAGADFPHPVGPPLSQGTLDQIYLATRLAIVDHLDANQEPLPIFLDEVFVNWDTDRRNAAFDILRDMAETRQVFLFTCHPPFAKQAARKLHGKHLNLDRTPVPAHINDDLSGNQSVNGDGVGRRH